MYGGNHYQLMADYNQWLNQRLFAVCATLSDAQRKSDRGAFFKSIHGTLNHVLWGDRTWLTRFKAHNYPLTPIGEDLYADFDELRAQRETLDAAIVRWAGALAEDWLQQPLTFTSVVDAKTRKAPAWIFVTQFFNHQTHHRGQVSTLIKQFGVEPGVMDIPWMPGAIDIV
jgi:uncharacterized damage-inducible protein DinB